MLRTPIKNTLLIAVGLGLLAACNNSPVAPAEPLKAFLSSSLPTSSTIDKPTTITFNLSATGGTGISKLELHVISPIAGLPKDSIVIFEPKNTYSYTYNISAGNGKITFYAKAFDGDGTSKLSTKITYTNTIDTTPIVEPPPITGGSDLYKLRQVDLNIMGNAQCNTAYQGGITGGMVCATAPQKDSCQGDSGGPLLSKNGPSWMQLGIVSFGIGCASPRFPGVYTRTDQYLNWISNKTGGLITNKATRIVGGNVAAAGAYPFMVAILAKGYVNNYDAQFCGASLIGSKWVLTAAHCAADIPSASSIWVLLGTQDLALGGTRVAVKRIIVHESYDPDGIQNDIALLELSNEVTTIPTVSLPPAASSLYDAGNLVTVIGWGETVAKAN
jgi:secreted trypsin-like serine protease